jgi:hypothetical protein
MGSHVHADVLADDDVSPDRTLYVWTRIDVPLPQSREPQAVQDLVAILAESLLDAAYDRRPPRP